MTTFGMELTVKVLKDPDEFLQAFSKAKQNYETLTGKPKPPLSPADVSRLLRSKNRFDVSIEAGGNVVGFIAMHYDPETYKLTSDQVIRVPTVGVSEVFEALHKFLTSPADETETD